MNGDKKINELLDTYKKPLKKLFKYDKSNALTFDKESRNKVEGQKGVFVIFYNKKPIFVGQAGGYMTGYKLTQKDLNDKLAQFNLKSDAGTARFRRVFAEKNNLDETEVKEIKAETYGLKFQFIKVKGNPAMINTLEMLALEYAKSNDIALYNFL
ncbi:hypothetical protein [Staphylococcus edaphicus]|uniref:Uncharacterized protein n=1 Tax=Staphylococcus edaphicus TaxID=1955013 RepID=A0A2C6WKJ9_9STAP|nr:hypothetical protein [Staphylococcus edaphicus]PHK48899.1 hypothetical protein BTJ66_11045 [Staphylococcus edaphicus]UQW81873.1 hypothetical protein MNY58_01785 [Staphylococcus edaphicus]